MNEAQHRAYARGLLAEAEQTEDQLLRTLLLADIQHHQSQALAMQLAALAEED